MTTYPRYVETITASSLLAVLEEAILAYGPDIPVFIRCEGQELLIKAEHIDIKQTGESLPTDQHCYLELWTDFNL